MARTKTLFIWTGDYADQIDRLYAAANAASADKTQRTADEGDPLGEIETEWRRLKDEADEAGLKVVVRGLSDDEWYDITDNHPARTEEPHAEGDKALGYNERTGLRPMILAGMVEPEFTSRAKFDAWVTEKGLSRGDLNMIGMTIWRLTNGQGPIDPKSLPPLRTPDDDEK